MTDTVFSDVVRFLRAQGKTISTMESCTGGGVANAITNIEGASNVIAFSAVTYSNAFKIKMGVSPDVIETYTVYSVETAREMSRQIALYAGSDFGVGVTGQLRRVDEHNPVGKDDCVFYSIWNKAEDMYVTGQIVVDKATRAANKDLVIDAIGKELIQILEK